MININLNALSKIENNIIILFALRKNMEIQCLIIINAIHCSSYKKL